MDYEGEQSELSYNICKEKKVGGKIKTLKQTLLSNLMLESYDTSDT